MLQAVPEPPTIRRELYTVADVAFICSLSQTSIRTLIRSGELKAFKIGSALRIKADDLERWLAVKSRE